MSLSNLRGYMRNDLLPLAALAVPLIVTGVMQSSTGFFENVFLSRLGENVLAAGALVNWLFATLIVVLFGTFSSVNILISHKQGANDKDGIVLVLRDGFLLAVLLALPTFLLFWNLSSVFTLLGQNPELVALAKLYLHALAWGLFPKFILIVLYEFLLGLGHSRVIMVVTMLSIPLYIFFSFILIFGKFGLPALGIAGAGWGMTFADWIISSIACILLFSSKKYRPYINSIFTWKKPSYLWEILHLGVPMGAMFCIEVGFFFAITLVMGTIGIQSLAANQVTMQYLSPIGGIIFSIGQAITVRMGHQLGAHQVELAKRTASTGITLSIVFMSIIAMFYWLTPKTLISVDFDVNNPNYFETVRMASEFLFIAAFFQILESIRIALFAALRALKDTHFTLLTSIISFWFIALPLGYLWETYFHFGGKGLWWGMVVGAGFSVFLLHGRFKTRIHRYQTQELSKENFHV
jgi:MATE family multidrug resistance protein